MRNSYFMNFTELNGKVYPKCLISGSLNTETRCCHNGREVYGGISSAGDLGQRNTVAKETEHILEWPGGRQHTGNTK